VTVSSSARLPRAFATPEAGFDYFATEVHYRSLAGRIVALLGGFTVVVVTGDPPASARFLSPALSEAAASRHTVFDLSCGPELGRHDLLRFRHALSTSLAGDGATGEELVSPAAASLIVVVGDADRLSDEAIEEIFKNIYLRTSFDHRRIAAAVLLARPDFLARLERPVLRFWLAKRLLVARLRFMELGNDEILTFIRRQIRSDEGESAFTDETVIAIANVSGGDPMVVNRFSRRLLDFAAATTGNRLMKAAASRAAGPTEVPAEERGVTIIDKPQQQGGAMPVLAGSAGTEPSTRMPRGAVGTPRLLAAIVFCLACGGVAAGLWMHPTEDKAASASGTLAGVPASIVHESALSTGGETATAAVLTPFLAEPAPTAAIVLAAPPQQAPSIVSMPGLAAAPPVPSPSKAVAAATEAPVSIPTTPVPAPAEPSAKGAPTAAATPTIAARASTTAPAPLRLSAAEIAGLLARGDEMFGLGDVSSARLFYERAAEGGEGRAALRLGNTFDPVFLDFAHLHGVRGDAGVAVLWYRRARDLGRAEAEILLKRLDPTLSKDLTK
jgi:hypothetical protein